MRVESMFRETDLNMAVCHAFIIVQVPEGSGVISFMISFILLANMKVNLELF